MFNHLRNITFLGFAQIFDLINECHISHIHEPHQKPRLLQTLVRLLGVEPVIFETRKSQRAHVASTCLAETLANSCVLQLLMRLEIASLLER